MKNLTKTISNWKPLTHIVATIGAFCALGAANTLLNASYAASKFPVPYQEGQTAFNAETIKGYYQFMLNEGTLGVYWQTQFIDFLFIAAMFAFGLLMPLLLRRGVRPKSIPHRIFTVAAILIPLGAILDAIENLISFVMLAQPLTFPNWIAPIYSSVATLKFAAIGAGYLSVVAGLLLAIIITIGQRLVLSTTNQ